MGKESTKSEWTGDCLSSEMDVVVKVEVEVATCVVTFILKGESIKWVDYPTTSQPINGTRKYKIKTELFKDPARQFVPCYQIEEEGDTVTW